MFATVTESKVLSVGVPGAAGKSGMSDSGFDAGLALDYNTRRALASRGWLCKILFRIAVRSALNFAHVLIVRFSHEPRRQPGRSAYADDDLEWNGFLEVSLGSPADHLEPLRVGIQHSSL